MSFLIPATVIGKEEAGSRSISWFTAELVVWVTMFSHAKLQPTGYLPKDTNEDLLLTNIIVALKLNYENK